jgi:endonuclease/exonuclease/phosphatase family metal-dependent hydrolase
VLRVATFNTCRAMRGKGTPVENVALVEAAGSLRADVLALQEVDVGTRRADRADQVRLVADACGASHAFVSVRRENGGRFGNAVVVRGELRDVEAVKLPGRGWPGFRDRRAGMIAEARVGELTVTLAVAHLSTTRADATAELRRLLDRLGRRPGSWILGGDFNLGAAAVAAILAGSGLSLVRTGGPTFPASAPRARIDHIALRGLTPGAAEVVALAVSDHRALVLEVEVAR